ncbi:hypothetical protein CP973_08600 [Streptomyces albofaciens JCM 4342]|nr:hypothetical protein CP973_08600 [Streptomyces albofaciens JCM 4342]
MVRRANKLLEEWGSPEGATLHDLRHFYASVLIKHGATGKKVQRLLAHAKHSITWDLYIHLREDAEDDTADIMDAFWRGVPSECLTASSIGSLCRSDQRGRHLCGGAALAFLRTPPSGAAVSHVGLVDGLPRQMLSGRLLPRHPPRDRAIRSIRLAVELSYSFPGTRRWRDPFQLWPKGHGDSLCLRAYSEGRGDD